MAPLMSDEHMAEFFKDLADLHETGAEFFDLLDDKHTPHPKDLVIRAELDVFLKIWTNDPAITTDQIGQGKRLGKLMWKHTSAIEVDRDWYIYVCDCGIFDTLHTLARRHWLSARQQLDLEPFVESAFRTYHNLVMKHYEEQRTLG